MKKSNNDVTYSLLVQTKLWIAFS